MKRKAQIGSIIILTVIVVVILVFVVGYSIKYAFTEGHETITIQEKWVKYKGNDAKYLVSATDGQVFEITDSLVHTRWDSSNLYARLKVGEICKIKTQGFRFGFFSDYKNIIIAECEKR